ncbi:MAG: hypothetical protein QGH51_05690 [Planctomycetota bacterium]|jgi:hypothetical protein|nr:hypothetical protein [Planctomycetota bacterium]MDP6941502.1 hypothetical protein [Planctomycetota bacterium]
MTQLLNFHPGTSFDSEEQESLCELATLLGERSNSESQALLESLRENIERVSGLAIALAAFPPIFGEQELGARSRGRDSLVDLLTRADDTSVELYLPTRAIVGRSLVMAELNTWRLASYLLLELFPEKHPLSEKIEYWMYSCIYTRLAEDVLQSIAMDTDMERRIRVAAVDYLSKFWESRHLYGARHFFPLLAATWGARRRIRVSVGTLLGVSEIMRLLQSGCDPEFVDYFSRPHLDDDEHEAFQEFLIGVSTEQIQSIAQLMEDTDSSSLSSEEAGVTDQLGAESSQAHECVRFYQFFRSRYLQAAARKLKNLPGPKKTAEEYVMTYFLDRKATA